MSAVFLLLFISPILAGPDGPEWYGPTYSKGKPEQNDSLLVRCLSEKGGVVQEDLKFTSANGYFLDGTIISAIEVSNLMTNDQAQIAKTKGGVTHGFVWFNIKSIRSHGIRFNFKIWGRVPGNTPVVRKHTGNCNPRR